MEYKELSAALEAILFASGDPVPAERIAQVLGADVQQVFAAADVLTAETAKRLVRTEMIKNIEMILFFMIKCTS